MFGLLREAPPEDRDQNRDPELRELQRSLRPRRSRRGFTLVEMLVVLAILALAILFSGTEAIRTLKRQRVSAAAQEIQNVLQEAPVQAAKRNHQAIVRVTGRAGACDISGNGCLGAPASVEVFSDENENGVLDFELDADPIRDPPRDRRLTLYTVPPEISFFSCVSVLGVPSVAAAPCDDPDSFATPNRDKIQTNGWSTDAVDTSARTLRLDYQGRTVNTATGRQIAAAATLNISHVHMLIGGGRLLPGTNYQIRINPVWHVSTVRTLWGP